MEKTLSPSQQQFCDNILGLLHKSPLVGARARSGSGRTTVLEQVTWFCKAPLVRLADIIDRTQVLHPLHVEEGILQTFLAPLRDHDIVIIDDMHVITELLQFGFMGGSARPNLFPLVFDALLKYLEQGNKTVVLGLRSEAPDPLHPHCLYTSMPGFTVEDFQFLITAMLGEVASQLDFPRIQRFASRLNAHQMRYIARLLQDDHVLSTDEFLRFLEQHALASNVNMGDVEEVTFDSLHGVDDVIRQLEVDVIVPLEHSHLAEEIQLQPKRGVLLYGPPGTGKTTIGRALAHRLRSKFFLIDGTVISGTPDFFHWVNRIFESAKTNAPSVLFIDDSDLLFENPMEFGLYRYLLTMLDGLASRDNAGVTVILTAMNLGSLPPALIRSGRVELWLEMKLPDAPARAAIVRDHLATSPAYLQNLDVDALAQRTEGLTGADLRRIVADAVNLYGYDVAKGHQPSGPASYFEKALAQLARSKERLEHAPSVTEAHYGVASRYMSHPARRLAEQSDAVGSE